MSRMDKYIDDEYEEETPLEEVVLSRVNKNQVMYDDVYFNRTKVDIDGVIESVGIEEKIEEPKSTNQEMKYEAKSYSVQEYLEKAHENKSPDNAKRDIDDTAFREGEDEIRKLIASIDEKEIEEDFFKDLKGDNEDTLVGAKMKTDDFNNSIYEALKEKTIDEEAILDHVLSDKTVVNLEQEEDEKLDHTFEEIIKSDNKIRRKRKQLPIIIFSITLFILVVVVLIVILR